MKKMMKVLAMVLAVMMMMSSAMIAFAEGEEAAPAEPEHKLEQQAEPEHKEEQKEEKKEEKSEHKAEKPEEPKAEKTEEPKIEEPKTEEPKTEEAENTETETVTFEDDAVPMSSGKALDVKVRIQADNENAKAGETVTLTAIVSADQSLEGREISYQWQVDKGDGQGFRNIEKKANKSTYTVKLTEKKVDYTWRVKVHVAD